MPQAAPHGLANQLLSAAIENQPSKTPCPTHRHHPFINVLSEFFAFYQPAFNQFFHLHCHRFTAGPWAARRTTLLSAFWGINAINAISSAIYIDGITIDTARLRAYACRRHSNQHKENKPKKTTVLTHYRPATLHGVARAVEPEYADAHSTSGLKIAEVSTLPTP
tara:strand:+ start:43 stop:537 length:495 start_codon:yes stop_codon:yes gene_type:complete